MPWSPKDANRFTKAADTTKLRELWANVANQCYVAGDDEGSCVKKANAAVKKQIRRKKRKRR